MISEDTAVEICRDVMAALPAGVAVMTLADVEGVRRGMTISSLTPVSVDPPSVLMCIGEMASSKSALVEGQTFCANILASDQIHHSVGFAYGEEEPFDVFEWEKAPDGTPILSGTAAYLLCRVERVVEHHGTNVVLAAVLDGSVDKKEALVYWNQAYYGDLVPVDPSTRGNW